MTPGPNLILRIPGSRKLVKISTIGSGNTCGMRCWTDGKCVAPMMPDNPRLQMHPKTGELFWRDEAAKVNAEEPWEPKWRYKWVPFAVEPDLDGYRRALEKGMGSTRDRLIDLHLRFWWAANDPFRDDRPDFIRSVEFKEKFFSIGSEHDLPDDPSVIRPPDFAEKLEALIELLDEADPEDRVMIAEARRQLGDFEAAAALLEDPLPKGLVHASRVVQHWNNKRDTHVRELLDDQ